MLWMHVIEVIHVNIIDTFSKIKKTKVYLMKGFLYRQINEMIKYLTI